jgi:hypothetical protein
MLSATQIHLPQKVQFMSQEDQRQLKAMALLDYVESKQEFAMLWERISQIGDFLRIMGEDLKTDPSMYAYEKYTWLSQVEVHQLVKTLAELEEKMYQLEQKALGFGVSI